MPRAEDDPRALAATAMRRLNHAMVAHDADAELLGRIAAQAHATADLIEAAPRRQRPIGLLKRQMWESPPPDGEPMAHFDECIVSGTHNPMGIGMTPRRVGDAVEAVVHLGAAYEGAPQRSHGGIVAAILDDIMGYVLLVQRTPAYTGHLGVTYLAPTPVGTEILARAWLVGRDGRKLSIAGSIELPDGTPIAEGTGLFVAIPPERLAGA